MDAMTMFMKRILSLMLAASLAFVCICTAPLSPASEVTAASDYGVFVEGEIDDYNPEIPNEAYVMSFSTFAEAMEAISSTEGLTNESVSITDAYTIDGAEEWSYNGYVSASAPITVPSGSTLTINGGNYTGLNITVEEGGQLVLNADSASGTANLPNSSAFSSTMNVTNTPADTVSSVTLTMNGSTADFNTRLLTFDATAVGGSLQTAWYSVGDMLNGDLLCTLCGYPAGANVEWVYGESNVWDLFADTVQDNTTLVAREYRISGAVHLEGTLYSKGFDTVSEAIAAAATVQNAVITIAEPITVSSDQTWSFTGTVLQNADIYVTDGASLRLDVSNGVSYTSNGSKIYVSGSLGTSDSALYFSKDGKFYNVSAEIASGCSCQPISTTITGTIHYEDMENSWLFAGENTNISETYNGNYSERTYATYIFSGDGTYYCDDGHFDVTYMPGGEADFEPFPIEYGVYGGSKLVDPTSPDVPTRLTAPDGYEIKWQASGMAEGEYWNFETDLVTGDLVLTAVTIPLGYTITYDLPTGATYEGITFPSTYTYGEEVVLPDLPDTDGEYFIGWTEENNPEGIKEYITKIDKTKTGDIRLTSVWSDNPALLPYMIIDGDKMFGFGDFGNAVEYAKEKGIHDIYLSETYGTSGTEVNQSFNYVINYTDYEIIVKRYKNFKGPMFLIDYKVSDIIIENITIDGGGATDCGGPILEIQNAKVYLSGVVLKNNNNPNGNGGAINVDAGQVTMEANFTTTNCSAQNGDAIYNNGILDLYGDSSISNCSAEIGGAIYNEVGSQTTLYDNGVGINITGNTNSSGEPDNIYTENASTLSFDLTNGTSFVGEIGLSFSEDYDYATAVLSSTAFDNNFTLDKECGYEIVKADGVLKFAPKEYTVTYITHDPYPSEGTEEVTTSTGTYAYGVEKSIYYVTTGNPAYSLFDHWYTDENYTKKFDGLLGAEGMTGDLTLYGRYLYYYDCFNFETNGGELDKGVPGDYGNSGGNGTGVPVTYFVPPTPTREHYSFAGWYDNPELTGEPIESINLSRGSRADYEQEFNLYAKWNGLEYTDTYIIVADEYEQNEATSSTKTYTYPQEDVTGIPVTVGYRMLTGWYKDEACTIYAVPEVDYYNGENSTVYGKYEYYIDNYEFDTDGGEIAEEILYTDYILALSLTLPVPEKENYVFEGWHDNPELTGDPIEAVVVDLEDHKFYAAWSAVEYDIAYELDGGTLSADAPVTYSYGEGAEILLPTKEYHTFTGWYNNSALTGTPVTEITAEMTGDITLYAAWEKNQYTDTYIIVQDKYDIGSSFTRTFGLPYEYTGETSEPSFRQLKGWFTDEGCTAAAVPYEDFYTAGSSTVYGKYDYYADHFEYKTNGGVFGTEIPYTAYFEGRSTTLPVPERVNYTFAGWYDNAALTGEPITAVTVEADKDYTFYADWTANEYEIAYELNGGTLSADAPAKYTYSEGTDLVNPTRANYTFAGWYDNDDLTGTAVTEITAEMSGKITLYADWTANEYKVTVSLNGGSVSEEIPTEYSLDSPLKLSNPTKSDFIFRGWIVSGPDNNYNKRTLMSIPADMHGDATITAVWARKYTANRIYSFVSRTVSFSETADTRSPVIQIENPPTLKDAEDVTFEILNVTETPTSQIYTIRATGTVDGETVTEDATFTVNK